MINDYFLRAFPLKQSLDIDEKMISYYRPHPGKPFIRIKPIRFDLKAWCLNCSNDYLEQFDFYQGKDASKMAYPKDYGEARMAWI
ncbi:hypothetical protein X975_20861, partial [Stegodyphus mimosarum]